MAFFRAQSPSITAPDAADDNQNKAERITKLCAGEWGESGDAVIELREKAIAGQMPEAELAAELLKVSRNQRELNNIRASRSAPVGHGGGGRLHRSHLSQTFEASLLLSAGTDEDFVARQYGEEVVNAAMTPNYRDCGLGGLMRAVVHAGGGTAQGGNALVHAAFEAERSIKASGFSTFSLPAILGNVANKSLLAEYEAAETTWRKFYAVSALGDFKPAKKYRLHLDGSFREVAADGELKHSQLSESGHEQKLETHGTMLGLTRQDLINDDLDAFAALPRALGRAAAVQIEEAVYRLLLSNVDAFYSVGNNNLLTGDASDLSIQSLTAAKTLFRHRVGPNGKPLLVSPATLLVPPELESLARLLTRERAVTDPSDTTADTITGSVPAANPHANTLSMVVSPYLSNPNITDQNGDALTGQSGTAWYLFAKPTAAASIGVAFLNGRQTPFIESAEMDFHRLGIQWRAYQDFGVSMIDEIGSVKAAGEA